MGKKGNNWERQRNNRTSKGTQSDLPGSSLVRELESLSTYRVGREEESREGQGVNENRIKGGGHGYS